MESSGAFRYRTMVLEIPASLMDVRYNGAHFPGAPGVCGVEGGANCQQFAYTLLRHHGRDVPEFRSSELWSDRLHTERVDGSFLPLDLLLWHDRDDAWGAHVGVYVGDDCAIHLARSVGVPVVWALSAFEERPEYRVFIGAKRVRPRTR